MNLITAIRTVIKAAAIVIFGCGVGWSMAEFETQQLGLEKAVPPLSSCQAVFRQSDLARRLGEKFGPAFITPAVLCGDELLLVALPPDRASAPDSPVRGRDGICVASLVRMKRTMPLFSFFF
jgi:hypothetical protein